MSPKRRSSVKSTETVNKVAKTDSKSQAIHARVVISQEIQEAPPQSAIAARRAAIKAGTYRPEPEVVSEEEQELEEDNEVKSVTDEQEQYEKEMNQNRVMSPISGAATPLGNSTPNPLDFTENISKKLKNKMPQLIDYNSVSHFTPNKDNSCVINQEDDTFLFLGLRPGESIVFVGQIMVAALYGSVSIAGAVLSAGRQTAEKKVEDLQVSFYPVFSPRTHSLLSIHSAPMDQPPIRSHQHTTEIDENLIEALFEELADIDQFESVVVIKDLEGSGLEDMRDAVTCFSKTIVKLSKKKYPRDKNLKINYLPGFHPILQPTPGIKALKIESSWDVRTTLALENATKRESPVVSVVCGAKDMGKSSFSRYLVNRLLAKYNRVAYLEMDVGQSEFTPSGLLSLHYITHPILGPPYTHQQLEPERSFFFGSTTPRSNLDYYIACANELVDHWRQDQEKVRDEHEREWIPLVVNTQGWVSGVGYSLLIGQVQKVEPTDIFSMRHHMLDYKNLPPTFNMDIVPVVREAFMVAKEAPVLHYLDCVLQDEKVTSLADNYTATQQREITLGSYFHQTGMGNDHYLTPQWDFKKHMVDRTPWVLDWRQSLNAIWVIYEEVKLNELLYALNGSLVGLMGQVKEYKHEKGPKHEVKNDVFTPPKYLNTQDELAPSPKEITCHGLGIVRAIDPSRHALLLLTPVPQSTLEKVSCIIKGEIRLPLWSMFDHRLGQGSGIANVPWKKVPYITQESTEGAGATAIRVRRNLLRRSQA